jgi:hypothetical protein
MKVITIDGQLGMWVPIQQGVTERDVLVACGWTKAGHPGVRRSIDDVTSSWPEKSRPPVCDLVKVAEIACSIAYHKGD